MSSVAYSTLFYFWNIINKNFRKSMTNKNINFKKNCEAVEIEIGDYYIFNFLYLKNNNFGIII